MMMMMKDSEVEVTSEEEGLKGSWYRAILVDKATRSGRKKLGIRYLTLLKEEGSSSPLTETVDQSLIRPLPPENLYKDVVLEEGLVVDAYHDDGWWTGVVVKKIEEENKCFVYFDSPPDIIGYEKDQLRAHFHWTGCEWVGPETKELDKSIFSPGTMVEVRSVINKAEVAWFPALFIKEIEVDSEKKYIIKECKKHLSYNIDDEARKATVDTLCVRPMPPPFSCEEYAVLENVEAFRDGLGWLQGSVIAILSDKRYMVSLEATRDDYAYKHSDLRPFKVWKDGVWLDDPKQTPIKELPMDTSIAASPLNPRPENGEKLTTPETLVMSFEKEETSKDQGRKRNREEEHNSCLNEISMSKSAVYSHIPLGLSSDQSLNAEVGLPFEKTSSFWKQLETKEEYRTLPQNPHFRPLWEAKEDTREFCAMGLMLRFYEVLGEVKELHLGVSSDRISKINRLCAELAWFRSCRGSVVDPETAGFPT